MCEITGEMNVTVELVIREQRGIPESADMDGKEEAFKQQVGVGIVANICSEVIR